MTEFLFPYSLFLAKTVTWVIALLVIAIVVFGLVRDARSSGGPERLEVRNLNRRFEHLADTVRDEILDGAQLKALDKQRKHDAKSRSEEHTSELQSLMRTSYAVFCLTKQ